MQLSGALHAETQMFEFDGVWLVCWGCGARWRRKRRKTGVSHERGPGVTWVLATFTSYHLHGHKAPVPLISTIPSILKRIRCEGVEV